MRLCTVLGCEKKHRARGMCITHYNAWHHQTTHITPPQVPPQPWVCVCEEPDLGWLNECRKCRRKPYALLRVKP